MALARAIGATASTPVLRSDGPPVGGTPLMIGGEPWGEVVDGPAGEAFMDCCQVEKCSSPAQFAAQRSNAARLWSDDGTQDRRPGYPSRPCRKSVTSGRKIGRIQGLDLEFSMVSTDRNEQTQFNAIWRHWILRLTKT